MSDDRMTYLGNGFYIREERIHPVNADEYEENVKSRGEIVRYGVGLWLGCTVGWLFIIAIALGGGIQLLYIAWLGAFLYLVILCAVGIWISTAFYRRGK